MHSFGFKRYPLCIAWLLWLGATILIVDRYWQDPNFSHGLWAVPAVGFLFCIGVVLWASMEVDEDLAWKEKPPAEIETIQQAKNAITSLVQSEKITIVKNLDLKKLEGMRLHSWRGWRKTIEGFFPIMGLIGLMHLILGPVKLLVKMGFEDFDRVQEWARLELDLIYYLPWIVLGVIYFFRRVKPAAIYDSPLERIQSSGTQYKELNFYRYQNAAAKELDFDEVGDFRQERYARTIFLDRSHAVAIEAGVDCGTSCFKIVSATKDGKLLLTSTKEPDSIDILKSGICRYQVPGRGASGKLRWKSMAEAVLYHVQWVMDHLDEDQTLELAMLDEENLKAIMRESRIVQVRWPA